MPTWALVVAGVAVLWAPWMVLQNVEQGSGLALTVAVAGTVLSLGVLWGLQRVLKPRLDEFWQRIDSEAAWMAHMLVFAQIFALGLLHLAGFVEAVDPVWLLLVWLWPEVLSKIVVRYRFLSALQ